MTDDDLLKRLESHAHLTQFDGLDSLLQTAAQAAARIRELEADNKKLAVASEDYMVKLMQAIDLLEECERALIDAETLLAMDGIQNRSGLICATLAKLRGEAQNIRKTESQVIDNTA